MRFEPAARYARVIVMRRLALVLLASLSLTATALAQDLEPRRWAHLPIGLNIAGVGYAYTAGDLQFDPVLEIEDATVESHTVVTSYIRSFGLFGKSARFDFNVPYTTSLWEGQLSGAPASRRQTGFGDPWLRLSVNLLGAPALSGKAYQEYRAENQVNTILGVALGVSLPLGRYEPDKLLNLGQNRFVFRPQIGVLHSRGPWAFELSASAFLYTDNDDFFDGSTLEQDPTFAAQAHVIYTFSRHWWASGSFGYNGGGKSSVNDVSKEDGRIGLLAALSVGYTLTETQALKVVYIHGDARRRVGADTSSVLATWSIRF